MEDTFNSLKLKFTILNLIMYNSKKCKDKMDRAQDRKSRWTKREWTLMVRCKTFLTKKIFDNFCLLDSTFF